MKPPSIVNVHHINIIFSVVFITSNFFFFYLPTRRTVINWYPSFLVIIRPFLSVIVKLNSFIGVHIQYHVSKQQQNMSMVLIILQTIKIKWIVRNIMSFDQKVFDGLLRVSLKCLWQHLDFYLHIFCFLCILKLILYFFSHPYVFEIICF